MPRNMTLQPLLREMNPSQWTRGGICACPPPERDIPHSHDQRVRALVALFDGETVGWRAGNNLRDGGILCGATLSRLIPRPRATPRPAAKKRPANKRSKR